MIKRVIKECMISFIENSRKCKLNCLGLKQISSCLGMKNCGEGHERRITEGHEEILGVIDMFIILSVVMPL